MDPLSEVFSTMRVMAPESTRLEARAPWGWRSSGEAGDRVTFVLVRTGHATLKLESQPDPISLSAGDVFILFNSDPYILVDAEESEVVDCGVVADRRVGNTIYFGGGGALTTFISGSFAIDPQEAGPILSVLPVFLHLRLEQVQSQAFQAVLELLSLELARPGLASEVAVSRLYDLLFVFAIRAFADSDALPDGGWLAAVSDKHLGRAAKAMHARMEQPWTLQTLAEEAGMSRTAFATKFKATVGQTPLDYLTHWRMHRAGLLIRRGSHSLLEAARAVGYDSESSFSRVFKRTTGVSPGSFKRQNSSAR